MPPGARVAVHCNLPDSGLAGLGADSIEHGQALNRAELTALGARGGAWTPTLCAVLGQRDSPDPEVRARVGELRERLRDHLPYAAARGVRILAGTDVVGTIADEIALLGGDRHDASPSSRRSPPLARSRVTSLASTRRATSSPTTMIRSRIPTAGRAAAAVVRGCARRVTVVREPEARIGLGTSRDLRQDRRSCSADQSRLLGRGEAGDLLATTDWSVPVVMVIIERRCPQRPGRPRRGR